MSLLADLKQRKLVQWALAYAAAAFALVQGVDIVAAKFGWPDSVERMLIIAAFVGFLVTLLLAWYHGERGAQKVSGTELLLLSLLLAIGGGLLWKFARKEPMPVAATASVASASEDRRSIAVLPFINMSGDKDNEYFSDGISEEILNVLARTADLHVAARTSSFSFKGKSMEVPVIAHELNVRMVLEGSVRKQGDRVRITAQLIDAKTGFHAWSQTYDRQLKDIFAIQDEIANSIGNALEVKLADTPKVGNNSVGTTNLKAYDLYLRGVALWRTRKGESLWQAIALFEQAVAADPRFAQAYAGQALVYSVLADYSARIGYQESARRARDFAERALGIDITLPEPYVVLGYIASNEHRREATRVLFDRAVEQGPSFATALQWRGTTLMTAGALEAGLASLERAAALDPRSLIVSNNLSWALITLGRYQEARTICERALVFEPQSDQCLDNNAMASLFLGDLDAAQGYLDRLTNSDYASARPEVEALLAALRGRGDGRAMAQRLAAFGLQSSSDSGSGNLFQNYEVPLLMVLLGEHEQALAQLERLERDETLSAPEWAIMVPVLDPIRCDPRFIALVKKLDTTDPHFARVCGGKH